MDNKSEPMVWDFLPGHPLSYTTTKVSIFFNDSLLSTATAFVMRYGQSLALVTNWHVLSGINAATGKTLSNSGARPNRIECHVTVSRKVKEDSKTEVLLFKPLQIDLVSGEIPIWRDDRTDQSQNDYAIIDLYQLVPELKEKSVSLRHIVGGNVAVRQFENNSQVVGAIYPTVGAEVFVLGYPHGIASTGVFPIWKRASIASEPQGTITLGEVPYKNLFYIDGLTKSGMSGSPVICLAKPGDLFVTEDGGSVTITKAEPLLVGVYAGRDGVTKEEYELSLGRVWKIGAVEALFYNRRTN